MCVLLFIFEMKIGIFLRERQLTSFHLLAKLLIHSRFWVKWPMRETEEIRLTFFGCYLCVLRELRFSKPLPNVVDSHRRRVHHISRIKTVVSEFIEHEFVSRKIRPIRLLHQLVSRSEEGRFRELILVKSIFDMTNGRNGNQHFFLTQKRMLKEGGAGADNLLDGESPAEETRGGQFVAIPYDFPLHFIYPSRSPGDNQSICCLQRHSSLPDTLVDHSEAFICIGRRESTVMEHGVV